MSITRRIRRPLAAVALPLLLASCVNVFGPDAERERDRLDRNWSRWDSARILDYDFVIERSCYCGFEITEPVRVLVRHGQVVDRYYVRSGYGVDPYYWSIFPSVDGLFSEIADAIRSADELDVSYQMSYGYPVSIDIDQHRNAADDEMRVRTYGFVFR